jgi:hypothetical protein
VFPISKAAAQKEEAKRALIFVVTVDFNREYFIYNIVLNLIHAKRKVTIMCNCNLWA